IFEIDAVTDEMLNGIAHDVADADAQTNASYAGAIAPTPSDGDGRYFLDLIALQNEHPEVSSKQVLLPFLESTPFFQLDLVCTHLPPWLGGRTDLVVHTTPQGGTVRAVITRACEQAGTV
ncbi:MAG: Fe-only nitrogenase accessory AnfO family protein, partial [Acetanaerobacterium sp.]